MFPPMQHADVTGFAQVMLMLCTRNVQAASNSTCAQGETLRLAVSTRRYDIVCVVCVDDMFR